jgi:hypothetical protein
MKTKLLTFFLYLIAVELALPSMATHAQGAAANGQYGSGIVNAAGQWAQQIGTAGAQANRNTANQLFQQALADKAQGIATLNVGLLSQALTEAQQGIKADDQARHLAQTSLEALQSGNTSGQVDLSGKYGTSEEDMRDLANNSSPYLGAVQSAMSSFGIQVDHSSAVIKSPFGTFPIDASPDAMGSALGKIANALGYSANGVNAGIQSGLANANNIATKAMADAQAALGAGGAGRNPAATTGAAAAAPGAAGGTDKLNKEVAKGGAAKAGDASKVGASGLTAEQDMRAREAALAKSREELLRKMGSTSDSLGGRADNLFAIVHERYQEMRHQGQFNEYGQKMAYLPPH